MTELGSLAQTVTDPVPYAAERRVTGPIELEYQFMYQGDVHTPLPLLSDYQGPIPARDTIILFGGPEGDALESANLPVDIWVVHRVIFDFVEGNTRRVSVTMRHVVVVEAGDSTLLH